MSKSHDYHFRTSLVVLPSRSVGHRTTSRIMQESMSTVVPVTLPSDMWYMTVSDTSMCSDFVTVKIVCNSTCLKREKWG
jgi:hypothetical protein